MAGAHVFSGEPGPEVTMRLTDQEALPQPCLQCRTGRWRGLYGRYACASRKARRSSDFLTLFSINRLSLGSYPIQKVLRAIKMRFRKRQQANRQGQGAAATSPITTISATTSTSCSSTRTCSIPAPISASRTRALEQAQRNKLRLLASKLCLEPRHEGARYRLRLGGSGAVPGRSSKTSRFSA